MAYLVQDASLSLDLSQRMFSGCPRQAASEQIKSYQFLLWALRPEPPSAFELHKVELAFSLVFLRALSRYSAVRWSVPQVLLWVRDVYGVLLVVAPSRTYLTAPSFQI